VSWTAAASEISTARNLNNRQTLVMTKIAHHLQAMESQNTQEREKNQFLLYVGGSGGVGKSWLIQAIETLFQVMDDHRSLCITASTGSAAANINGRTIHSAIGLNMKGYCSPKLEKLLMNKWKETKMLVLDEISMISGQLFSKISKRLNHQS
jgi:DNA replication protein DnaC